jgi:type VI secretion system protein ImpI/type VI secretion system protein
MPVTLRFQSTGTMPGSAEPVTMRGASLTIGRAPENDLVLPDADRMISSRHCVIEDHGTSIAVIDISTNGTFLNYAKTPLGNTPTPLNAGDVLIMGTYELIVEMVQDAIPVDPGGIDMLAPAREEGPVSHGDAGSAPDALRLLDDGKDPADFLDGLLGPSSETTGPARFIPEDPLEAGLAMGDDEEPLLEPAPEEALAPGATSAPDHAPAASEFFPSAASDSNFIPDDWDANGDEGAPAPPDPPAPLQPETVAPPAPGPAAAAPAAPPPTQPEAQPAQPATQSVQPEARPEVSPRADAGQQSAARAFLKAAGVEDLDILDEDLAPVMARAGTVMQALVTGMREVLMTRAAIKSEFRMKQTMMGSTNNNPLKFSISPEQALEAMIRPRARGYLDPATAAHEALGDIKAHEVAMLTGIEAALKGVLKRLDPEVLEERIGKGGETFGFLKGKKARYWEVYEKMYAEISDEVENDFHDLFSKEFSRAYQEQIDKL